MKKDKSKEKEKRVREDKVRETGILVSLKEKKDKEPRGTEWDVVLIQAGLSKNQTFYPEGVLEQAVPLFEGLKSYQGHSDCLGMSEWDRDVGDLVGWFKDVRFEDGKIKATFLLSPAAGFLRVLMVDAWERGKKDIVGFSIEALATSQEKFTDQGVIHEVEQIIKVFSVDVVTEPAAGGAVEKLVASKGGLKTLTNQEGKMKKRMLQALREVDEKRANALPEGASEEEILKALKESATAVMDPPAEGKPNGEGGEGDPSKGKGKEGDPEPVRLAESDHRLLEASRMSACQIILDGQLKDCNLPQPMKESLKREFGGKVFDSTKLIERIQENRTLWAAMEKSGEVKGLGDSVKVGDDERDKLGKALDGFFANEDVDKIPRFRGFREAHRKVTGQHVDSAYDIPRESYPGRLVEGKRLRESLQTSDWAQILGDSVRRRMLAEYQIPTLQDWRKIVSDVVSVSDFRTNRRTRMGGYGTLPAVAAKGTYQALTSPGDEEVTYAATKRGGTEDLTIEMVSNDDVGAIRRIPVKLGRAAAITLYRFVFDFIVDNGAMDYDATALFHANHNNLGSTALSSGQLDTARQEMRSQSAFGASTEILGIVPMFLLVPNELENLGWRLSRSDRFMGGAAEDATSPNLHKGIVPCVVDYWTDANDWTVVADPKMIPTIEIGFFEGREEPELFVQDLKNVGSVFDSDTITYKIRHIYGGDVLDHRGFWKSVVA